MSADDGDLFIVDGGDTIEAVLQPRQGDHILPFTVRWEKDDYDVACDCALDSASVLFLIALLLPLLRILILLLYIYVYV